MIASVRYSVDFHLVDAVCRLQMSVAAIYSELDACDESSWAETQCRRNIARIRSFSVSRALLFRTSGKIDPPGTGQAVWSLRSAS